MENLNGDKIKLFYFNFNGYGCAIKAILAYKKIVFENIEFTSLEHWRENDKHSELYEFELMPMLEINGERWVETAGILLALAKKFDLMGSTLQEDYIHRSNIFLMNDIFAKFGAIVKPESPQEIKYHEANIKEFTEVLSPLWLHKLEQRYIKWGGKYVVGNTISLSDFILCCNLYLIYKNYARKDAWEPIILKYAPTLSKHIDYLVENDLAEYFKKFYIDTYL